LNRTPLSALNLAQQALAHQAPAHQALPSPDFSKAQASSPLGSPRLSPGARHSLPERPGEIGFKSPAPALPFAATGVSQPQEPPLTPPGMRFSGQFNADLPAIVDQLTLVARDATADGVCGPDKQSFGSKQVTWREESPYKPSKRSVLDTGGASSGTGSDSSTASHTAYTTSTTTSTTTATAVSTATAGTSTSKHSPRSDRKFWSVWSKNKENSPARPKLQRNTSSPQKGVAVKFSRQRIDTSPAWDLAPGSPKSPDRQSDALHASATSRTPTGRSSSVLPQWKSPHAVVSAGSASPGVAASPDFRAPFARTYSSLELPNFHRIDEPIVVISAWGTVVGTIKIHLERCMQTRPVGEHIRKAIEDAATNFAVELNQSKPSRSALNKALLKLALLIRDVDSSQFHASLVMKYHITQMAAAIDFMPDELPSKWRIRIESEAVAFGAWVLHGITADQADRSQSQ
jgi:hypothetical protein